MLDIALLPEEYAVCRLPADSTVPAGLLSPPADSGVLSVTRSGDELSIICRADHVPADATVETPWRCLRVAGPLDLALTGILASLVVPLADARVNIVAFSTFDTDYLLVPSVRLVEALAALRQYGHRITT
ncbi:MULTISPECIES: ACT domain-containing protein [unclassified Plantactinospora]|uniref:ACT domain-containing protein n=1 Tax=unclassified Plantactinospora TaxID=2631981 RepID=UPI000D162341|nr:MULTISPECIES: ACT domain-containing protein [unclassified Plantactinospora]AVT31076.1 ACT domain-containing protein [Plantactinospora sp. BC1]AVT40060.1 ACT domain-containing protein [Plantactinospora sp. BB1]